jgi:hypothetical protein
MINIPPRASSRVAVLGASREPWLRVSTFTGARVGSIPAFVISFLARDEGPGSLHFQPLWRAGVQYE